MYTHCLRAAQALLMTLLLTLGLLLPYQNAHSSTIKLDSPSVHINLTNKLLFLDDTTQKLTADDILSDPINQQFTEYKNAAFRFGFSDTTVWISINLTNENPETLALLLYFDRPHIKSTTLFERTPSGMIELGATGHQHSQGSSSVEPNLTPAFEISLNAGQERQFYLKLESSRYLHTSLHVADPLSYSKHYGNYLLWLGLAGGVIFGAFCYCLFIGVRFRSTRHIEIAAYSAATMAYLLAHSGHVGFQALAAINNPKFEIIALLLLVATSSHMQRNLLELRHKYSFFNKWFISLIVLSVGFILLAPFMSSSLLTQGALTLALIGTPVSLIPIVLRSLSGFTPARYFLLSRIILLGVAFFGAQTIYGTASSSLTFHSVIISTLVFEIILLSYVQLSHVKDRLIATQNQLSATTINKNVTHIKSNFLANLSHDIRTPMNGIIGMTELIKSSPLSTTQKGYIDTLDNSSQHLIKILDDVLDYSKLETGTLTLKSDNLPVHELFTDTVSPFESITNEKNITFSAVIADGLPLYIKGDQARLQQVMSILIANATKFTDTGGINVLLTPDRNNTGNLYFEVKDTGIGISRQQLNKLFKSTNAIDPAASSGLSLAIAHQLIRLMGGVLEADSQEGKGSHFHFSIPLVAANAPEKTQDLQTDLQGLRLLVVDDNASCRLVIEQQATSWGMQPYSAINGKQALALVRSQANIDESFDIIVLDHEMPGMNGMDLAARIQQDYLITHAPIIIMLTGLGLAPSHQSALDAGICKVLAKPVTGRALRMAITEALNARQHDVSQTEPSADNAIRVLLAEDHALSQRVLESMLERLEMECHSVTSGTQTLEALQNNRFDLILIDTELSDMSGIPLAQRIQEQSSQAGASTPPIVGIISQDNADTIQRLINNGITDTLCKPIEIDALQRVIITSIGESASPNQTTKRH